MRTFILLLGFLLPTTVSAVSRIDIHVGEIIHPAGKAEDVSATLEMDGRWQGRVKAVRADLPEISRDIALPFKISKGSAQGDATFAGKDFDLEKVAGDLLLRDLAFSDDAGLHAGEKIGGRLKLDARRHGRQWDYATDIDWREGEVFWQPLYLADGEVRLHAAGVLSDDLLTLQQGRLAMAGIGTLTGTARYLRSARRVVAFEAGGENLDVATSYAKLLKPFLDKTVLGDLETAGRADVKVAWGENGLAAFEVGLRDVDVEDRNGRFGFYKLQASIPWAQQRPTQFTLRYAGGHALKIPLGTTALAGTLNGYSLTAPLLRLPVLDGALTLTDVSAAFLAGQWHWHLGASLSPLSMVDFSHAVGWPAMQGKLAASIPMVTYTDGLMRMDGAMGINVFDGSVVIDNLALMNPLGVAPRLSADIRMRDLDLGSLTQTFSFGAMTGKLDGDVTDLELSRWQPVSFDADFHSSPGNYPKKISQRAVQNISALGGAGAAAAIQRSFLRFLEEFNYSKIGLSCKLRNGVCEMGGVETTQSGYTIVKGSGIPSITVLGYNRSVSWDELLQRIQRVTQGNSKPIIK